MKNRLRTLLHRIHGDSAEVTLLKDRVDQLEAEIDELRRNSLRVAELIDLAEQQLTPQPTVEESAARRICD